MKEDPDTKLNREMESIFREKGLMADQGGFVHANVPVGDKAATPERPAFKLAGSAEIRHINVRKEGPEDEKILAADIKLRFEKCDAAILAYFDDKLAGFLWFDGAMKAVRKLNMEPMRYSDWVSGHAKIAGIEFTSVDVKKFEIAPRDGGLIDLTCSVTLFPTQAEVGELARSVQDYVDARIEAHPDLFDAKEEPSHA